MQTLYGSGGKNFWIHNAGPLGCLPQKLSLPRKHNGNLDQYGCIVPFNNAAKELNTQLSILCDELRSELNGATIVYTDIFAIKYDIIANHTTYGELQNLDSNLYGLNYVLQIISLSIIFFLCFRICRTSTLRKHQMKKNK